MANEGSRQRLPGAIVFLVLDALPREAHETTVLLGLFLPFLLAGVAVG